MAKHNFHSEYEKPGMSIEIKLDLISIAEEGLHFIYSPAFDVTGYGKTVADAKKSFGESIEEFIRYTLNNGTFTSELTSLGWKIQGSKKNRKYTPPVLDQLFQEKDYLTEIVREKSFTRFNKTITLPA